MRVGRRHHSKYRYDDDTKARAWVLVDIDGERMCWKMSRFNVNDQVRFAPLDYDGPLREFCSDFHEVTVSGKASWTWKPSEKTAKALIEAFTEVEA